MGGAAAAGERSLFADIANPPRPAVLSAPMAAASYDTLAFLGGGGEMGERMRAHDWAASSLGGPETWPQSLRLTVRLVLTSNHPMFIWWGPDLIQFYNDAYIPLLGPERHPSALGQAGQACWEEIWPVIGPQIDLVMTGQGATWHEDQLIPVTRYGARRHVWWTYGYSPIELEPGKIGGVLVISNDVTQQHLARESLRESELRLRWLNETLQAEREAVKTANRGLAAETGFLRGLFEQAPSFMAVLRGPSHVFTLANPPYLALVGQRDLINKPIREAMPEIEGQGFFELLDQVYASGKPFVGHESRLLLQAAAGGPLKERYVDFVYQPIRGADGMVSGIFVEGTDVTERFLAHERLRIAQRAGGIGTFEWFPDEKRLEVSDEYRRIYGLPPGTQLTDALVMELVHPDDRGTTGPALFGISENPLDYSEYRITRPDTGEVRWIGRRGEVLPADERMPRRYLGVAFDISERKRVEEELRRNEERHAFLLSFGDTLRAQSEPREVMRAAAEMLGRHLGAGRVGYAEIDKSGCFMTVERDWTDGTTTSFAGHHRLADFGPSLIGDLEAGRTVRLDDVLTDPRLAEGGVATMFAELGMRAGILVPLVRAGRFVAELYAHQSGPRQWTHDEETLVQEVAERIWDALERARAEASLRDLNATLEQRVEERTHALHAAEEQLRQAVKMEAIGQLTGGIAHDFNNLLTGIIGSLDLIKRRLLSNRTDDLQRFMDAAIASAHRAGSLTHRLLAFARRQSLDTRPIDVDALVQSMEELLRRSIGEQVRMQVTLRSSGSLARTDANQLESAILNLVINARDAMPKGGELALETTVVTLDAAQAAGPDDLQPGDYVLLTLRDTGAGMPADVLARAFDPFFTTKPIGQGTGLGLSMIYGFAKQTGGHVRIDSEVGHGTTVSLFLPRAQEEAEPQAAESGEVPRGAGETVLVVEDDPAVRMLVMEVLQELGYRGLEAAEGHAALEIIESEQRLDLLVTDVGLPGLNGRQLAEIARQRRPGLGVLFVTGYAETAASRAGFLEPGMDMIAKPFAVDALAARIREMLAQGANASRSEA